MGIDYGNLPKDSGTDLYMTANTMIFSEDEVSELKDQRVVITDGTVIYSQLEIPIVMNEKEDLSELNSFIKSNVLFGNQYGLWDYDKEAGMITYYQKYKDKLFYMNRSAHLVFYVDEDNEITSYEQTMLEGIVPIIAKEEEVLPAIRAVEALYRKGVLKPGSKIVKSGLGYYTLVNMEATQVLTPTWHFVVELRGEKETCL